MHFHETGLQGAFVIELELHEDERGAFARTWCVNEFAAHGIIAHWVQCNLSYNRRAGTLRGLHYQADPYPEAKLIRCTQGAVYDVIVDLRAESATRARWIAVELSAANRRQLYVPKGFAHGFQTLFDETELFYQMSEFFRPELTRGVRWDDPGLSIDWPPCQERIIASRDLALPMLQPFPT